MNTPSLKKVDFPKLWCYNGNMSRKKTNEEFLAEIQDRLNEYEVLSEYKTATTKIPFRHKSCGTIFEMKPIHFIYGQGCPKCKYKRMATKISKTFDEFLRSLPEKYADWNFDGYTKVSSPVTATCPICGRTHTYASAKSFTMGTAGCRVCNNAKRKSVDYASLCEKQGLEFLGLDEQGIITRCKKCGEICYKQNCNLHKNGCRFCAYKEQGEKNKFTLAQANASLKEQKSSFEFVNYDGAYFDAKIRCMVCGHEFIGKAANYLSGGGHCPICSTRSSLSEKEIYQWVKGLCPDAISGDRSILRDIGRGGYELDIFVPSKKVAIEFNGRYWHSVQKIMETKKMSYAEAKKYHYLKSFWCEKAGIRLIHIWDYEWADEKKQKVLKNIILGALGMLPERYYARNTICKHYERGCARWEELGEFFENNNIQGNRGGSHVFTLEDKDGRILMAYKFGRPSGGKAKKLYEYEMVRGASAPGVQVVGGASKLWKHFVDTLHPNSAVYYIDYNYFDGRSVEKLGGKFIISQPGVKNYWVDTEKVKNREPARHAEVKKAIADGKVLEMWNAGTKTYAFTW